MKQGIWVTGSSGFIGSNLCSELAKRRDVSLEGSDLLPGSGTSRVEDLRRLSSSEWDERVRDRVAVFHMAATVSIPACQEHPAASEENNVGVTLHLLEALRREKARVGVAPRLFFASSAAVYGARGDDGRKLKETDVPDRFLSFYAAQKFAAEQLLHQYHLAFGLPTLSFRFFNVFGPGQDPSSPYSGVLSRFLHFLRVGEPLVLQGGGAAVRDFIHVSDVVRGLLGVLELDGEKLRGQAINLATGRSVSVREVAREVEAILRRSNSARWNGTVEAPARAGDVRVSTANIDRAKELLGFSARVSLVDGLTHLLAAE
jgi:UDP-glucose 4-epimerase